MGLHLITGLFLWAILLALAAMPAIRNKGVGGVRLGRWFLLVLAMALVAWRWNFIFLNKELNVDESVYLAQLLKFMSDPVPWRSVDGLTSGPLNSYVFIWAPAMGLPVSYLAARITGIACVFTTIFFNLKTLRIVVGKRSAMIAVFPLATFYLFTRDYGFVHFSSEHLPVALLSIAFWLIAKMRRSPTTGAVCWLGILLGAVPFTKLQAAPLAAYFSLLTVLVVVRQSRDSHGTAKRRLLLAVLCIGGLLVPLAILVPVIASGAWSEFISRYLVAGMSYQGSKWSAAYSAFGLFAFNRDGTAYLAGLFIATTATFLFLLKNKKTQALSSRHGVAGVLMGYMVLALYVAIKPRAPFAHYLLFLLCPALLMSAWVQRAGIVYLSSRGRRILPLAFLAICIVPQLVQLSWRIRAGKGEFGFDVQNFPLNPVIAELAKIKSPNNMLGMWGFTPYYYVETGLRPATREAISQFIVPDTKETQFRREQFLEDLRISMPGIFVDSSVENPAWSWQNETNIRFTNFPKLAEFIQQHYRLTKSLVVPPTKEPILIFVKKQQH